MSFTIVGAARLAFPAAGDGPASARPLIGCVCHQNDAKTAAPQRMGAISTMKHSISPSLTAQELRSKAASASGPEQAYLLWLASEWEKVAERESGSARAGPGRGSAKAASS